MEPKRSDAGGKKNSKQELQLTRMHSSRGISKTFSICDSTLSGSAFLRSIYERHHHLAMNNCKWPVMGLFYLVNDRDDCQLSFKSQVEVGHCLCLNSLEEKSPQNIAQSTSAARVHTTPNNSMRQAGLEKPQPDLHRRSKEHLDMQKLIEILHNWSPRDPGK